MIRARLISQLTLKIRTLVTTVIRVKVCTVHLVWSGGLSLLSYSWSGRVLRLQSRDIRCSALMYCHPFLIRADACNTYQLYGCSRYTCNHCQCKRKLLRVQPIHAPLTAFKDTSYILRDTNGHLPMAAQTYESMLYLISASRLMSSRVPLPHPLVGSSSSDTYTCIYWLQYNVEVDKMSIAVACRRSLFLGQSAALHVPCV